VEKVPVVDVAGGMGIVDYPLVRNEESIFGRTSEFRSSVLKRYSREFKLEAVRLAAMGERKEMIETKADARASHPTVPLNLGRLPFVQVRGLP